MSNIQKDNCRYSIYCVINMCNDKKYVGWTINPVEKRFQDHCYEAKRGSTCAFHAAIRKYGSNKWNIELLEVTASLHTALVREIFWIDKLKTTSFNSEHHGYNMTNGGEGATGRAHSEETKSKIGLKRKELKLSEGKNNPMFGRGAERIGENNSFWGKSHSIETKQKISSSKRGVPNLKLRNREVSQETRMKLSLLKKGKPGKALIGDDVIKYMIYLKNNGNTFKEVCKILFYEEIYPPCANKPKEWHQSTVIRAIKRYRLRAL